MENRVTLDALIRAKKALDDQNVPPPCMVWLPDMPEPVRLDDLNKERARLGLYLVE